MPGIDVQVVDDGDESTYKDFTVRIDEADFGLSRDGAVACFLFARRRPRAATLWPLRAPPARVHRVVVGGPLPVTDYVARRVVSLPIFPGLAVDAVDAVRRHPGRGPRACRGGAEGDRPVMPGITMLLDVVPLDRTELLTGLAAGTVALPVIGVVSAYPVGLRTLGRPRWGSAGYFRRRRPRGPRPHPRCAG